MYVQQARARLALASPGGTGPTVLSAPTGIGVGMPDVNGDHRPDVLELKPAGQAVMRDGRIGRTLWRTTTPPDSWEAGVVQPHGQRGYVFVIFGATLQAETPDVNTRSVDAPAAFKLNSWVAVLAPNSGRTLWTRTFTGQYLLTPFAGAGGGYVVNSIDIVFPAGLLRQRNGDRLLLTTFTDITGPLGYVGYETGDPPPTLSPFSLDAATGNETVRGTDALGDADVYAAPAGDVDGDGITDWLTVAQHAPPNVTTTTSQLALTSGATGKNLWSTTFAGGGLDVLRELDLTGDHRPDVVAVSTDDGPNAPGAHPTVTAYQGATGRPVWSAPGQAALPLGARDVAVISTQRQAYTPNPIVVIRALSGAGKALWVRKLYSPLCGRPADDLQPELELGTAGDVNGDGRPDVYLSRRCAANYKSRPYAFTSVVTSGSGAVRTEPYINAALGSSLDGRGDDLLDIELDSHGLRLRAVDGRTGRTLWRQRLAVGYVWSINAIPNPSWQHTARSENLVLTTYYFTNAVRVIAATNGRIAWTVG